jgi:formate dehydrogenase
VSVATRVALPTRPGAVAPAALQAVREALAGAAIAQRDLLIEHLHRLHDRFGHLRTDHLRALASLMKLSVAEIYEVATFYHHFDVVHPHADGTFAAPPRLTVRVCSGISCGLAGASELLQALPAHLGADVRVLPCPCIGRCDQAPAALVHQRPVPQATVEAIVRHVAADDRSDEPPSGESMAAYRSAGGYRMLAECLAGTRTAEQVFESLHSAGLRGLGGAGFMAARKWRSVRAEASPRLMAVNLDEGEPGTFKDRHFLERHPHRFLEGVLIAAWAVEIDNVFIYLRDEYHGCRALLERELAALRADPPMPNLPMIELRRGAGGYVCGEESAMMESIEGKRGLPRLRPPYVAQRGLFGLPTLSHNFETLYRVPEILQAQSAAESVAPRGRRGRTGELSFSVSGRVREPGVKRAPAGITLRELVDEYCGGLPDGHRLYAYLPGGASGGILPAALADIPLDFDTLQPHGALIGTAAVVVLSESDTHRDRAVDVARQLMAFFESESCGLCTPCRSGTAKASQLIAGEDWDAAMLTELSLVMREASICGLGRCAPHPVDCVLRYFAHELQPGLAP